MAARTKTTFRGYPVTAKGPISRWGHTSGEVHRDGTVYVYRTKQRETSEAQVGTFTWHTATGTGERTIFLVELINGEWIRVSRDHLLRKTDSRPLLAIRQTNGSEYIVVLRNDPSTLISAPMNRVEARRWLAAYRRLSERDAKRLVELRTDRGS